MFSALEREGRRISFFTRLIVIASLGLSTCTPPPRPENQTAVELEKTRVAQAIETEVAAPADPPESYITITPKPTEIPEQKPTITPPPEKTPTHFITPISDTYPPELKSAIESNNIILAKKKEQIINVWVNVWASEKNQEPLGVKGGDINVVFVPDDAFPGDLSKVAVALQSPELFDNNLFVPPTSLWNGPGLKIIDGEDGEELLRNNGNKLGNSLRPIVLGKDDKTDIRRINGWWTSTDPSGNVLRVVSPDSGNWVEPDMLINGVTLRINLDSSRQYVLGPAMQIVDFQSKIPMALVENGIWRQTSDEERFGALADLTLGEKLVKKTFNGGSDFNLRGGALGIAINMHSTGFIELDEYNDSVLGDIKEYRLLCVYRDPDGALQKVFVSLFSPDVPGNVWYRIRYPGREERNTLQGLSKEEALSRYSVPQKMEVYMVMGVNAQTMTVPKVNDTGIQYGLSTAERARMARAAIMMDELSTTFGQSLLDDNTQQSSIPENLVIYPVLLFERTEVKWENRQQ